MNKKILAVLLVDLPVWGALGALLSVVAGGGAPALVFLGVSGGMLIARMAYETGESGVLNATLSFIAILVASVLSGIPGEAIEKALALYLALSFLAWVMSESKGLSRTQVTYYTIHPLLFFYGMYARWADELGERTEEAIRLLFGTPGGA